MANFDIVEEVDSREYRREWGRANEKRVYKVNISENAEANTVLNPTKAQFVGLYPNPGGTPFVPVLNMRHPEGYLGTGAAGSIATSHDPRDALYMRLVGIEVRWISAPVAILVTLHFSNEPNAAVAKWFVDTSVQTEEVQTDINLKLIRGVNGEVKSVPRFVPQSTDRAVIEYLVWGNTDDKKLEDAKGKVNSTTWRGKGPGHWLLSDIHKTPVDDTHVRLEYSFQLNDSPDGWLTVIPKMKEDGSIDITAEPEVYELYDSTDFDRLPGLRPSRGLP